MSARGGVGFPWSSRRLEVGREELVRARLGAPRHPCQQPSRSSTGARPPTDEGPSTVYTVTTTLVWFELRARLRE